MTPLKDALEGKPLRTPLHPALVHVPIALFPISVVLDLLLWTGRDDLPLAGASFICLLAGIGSALLAAVFGLVDFTEIRDDHPAKKTATAHLILNLFAVALFAASAGLRYSTIDQNVVGLLPLVASLAGLAVIGYSGYLGGVLVYDDGIGVGRHRRRTRLPEATIQVRSEGKPVALGSDHSLAEGETLRVQVDDVIATVGRVDGKLCAFQEFCTHRYGPLSEGRLDNGKVTCPWHGSQFEACSGKVTKGPAKEDLRTFSVESRDGKIWFVPPPPEPAADDGPPTAA